MHRPMEVCNIPGHSLDRATTAGGELILVVNWTIARRLTSALQSDVCQ